MHRGGIHAYLITLAALAGAGALLAATGRVHLDATPPLASRLPDRIGPFAGMAVRFCQNAQCGNAYREDALGPRGTCPACDAALGDKAPAEHLVLPADTTILRKEYTAENAPTYTVAIVLAGLQRDSIHKPQVCLEAQGYRITGERIVHVPLAHAPPLAVKCLDFARGVPGRERRGQYVYWFVARDRETPYHVQRLLWTAWDGVVRGVHRRWTYVAIATEQPAGARGNAAAIEDFVAQLYPLIAPPEPRLTSF